LSQAKESIPSLQFLPNKCRATAANQHVVSGDLPVYDAFPHPVYGVMDSVGAAFAIGAVSDAAFHFVRGLVRGVPGRRRPRFPQQRAPRGWHPRFQLVLFSTIECVVALQLVLFSTIECVVARAQGREAPGFKSPKYPDRVYKISKALYELKQASRAWYARLKKFLLEHGYVMGSVDKTLFTLNHGTDFLLIHIYVDDIIFGVSSHTPVSRFQKMMESEF
jgi:hypothetical protein